MRLAALLALTVVATAWTFAAKPSETAIDPPRRAGWRTLDLAIATPTRPMTDPAEAIAQAGFWYRNRQTIEAISYWPDGRIDAVPLADGSLLAIADDCLVVHLIGADGFEYVGHYCGDHDIREHALAALDARPAWGWNIVDVSNAMTRLATWRRASHAAMFLEDQGEGAMSAKRDGASWVVRSESPGGRGWDMRLSDDGVPEQAQGWRVYRCGIGSKRTISRACGAAADPALPTGVN